MSTVSDRDVLLPWYETWDAMSPVIQARAGAPVVLGLTSLVQPEGLLKVAERG